MNSYQLIIVGGGISGLSTGLAWQRVYGNGNSDVVIFEKNKTVGGCVTSFARKGYVFDTTQIIPDISKILAFFDIDVPLLRFENYYARLFLPCMQSGQVKVIPIPSSVEGFEESLCKRYPEDAAQIHRFFSYTLAMYAELNYLKTEPRWYQLPGILLRCPKIIANSGKTYMQYLKRFRFTNPEVYQVLDIFSSFSGLSGKRCAALLTACAMITTLRGSYRPVKSFITFPHTLSQRFKEQGGVLVTGKEVKRILTDKGKVKGVELSDGTMYKARYVVSTADTKVTLEQLVGEKMFREAGKSYYNKIKSVKMSPSGFAIQLGLDDHIDLNALGFNCGYNVLTSDAGAHEAMFSAWDDNRLLMSDTQFHLAVICPSLMTGGNPTLIIHVVPAPAKYWINLRENNYEAYVNEKNSIAEFYIDKVEHYMIPHLKQHIVYKDISTPATYSRFIGTPGGSQYDMLPVPSNFGKNRLPTRTPIKGLFIPKFSHGIWPSLQAGLQVVDMISGGRIMNGNASLEKS